MIIQNSALLVGDKFFDVYPGKVLGVEKETTDQFGKPTKVVKGSLRDSIKKFPELPEPVAYDLRPAPQGSKQPAYEPESIEQAIEETQSEQPPPDTTDLNLRGMEDMIKNHSRDELEVWVYYQTGRAFDTEKIQQTDWAKYILSDKEAEKKKPQWLDKGLICFDGEKYVPAVIYYSGNIYEKIKYLQDNAVNIKNEIGESAFNKQLNSLENSKPTVLRLNSTEGSELFISPLDPLTEKFKINETVDDILDEETSLIDRFLTFLKNRDKKEFVNGSSVKDVYFIWIKKGSFPQKTEKAEKINRLRKAQMDGMKLFQRFLKEKLTEHTQKTLEYEWNSNFNAIAEMNYNKIPIGFEINKYFKNTKLAPRDVSWEGVRFLTANRSGCLAFDVGVGKTMTALFAMAQALYTGQCKRPLVVVPNPTYQKWIEETIGEFDEDGKVVSHGILPQYANRINSYYNLGTNYEAEVENNPPKDYTITFMTYEALKKLKFSEERQKEIEFELFKILNQGIDQKEAQELKEQIDKLLGSATANADINFDELGFDYIVVDEAHAFKKVFTRVKGRVEDEEGEGDGKREANNYKLDNGSPTPRAIKMFMLTQHILRNNDMRNVVLLTATPFTNSPLEIFSMLSLVAYQDLEKWGINNIVDFFDKFINETTEMAVSPKGKIEAKSVVKSFNNRIVLQNIIFSNIIHKTGEEANVPRPEKLVYPLIKDDKGIRLPQDQQVDTALQPSEIQENWMKELSLFANNQDNAIEENIPPEYYDPQSGKLNARVLLAINFQQALTLSPYLVDIAGKKIFVDNEPDYKEYVESSPKIYYVCQCIKSIKKWHEKRNEAQSGQVIYMNRGTEYFDHIKNYLVNEVGYGEKEVEIIRGGTSTKKKEKAKEKFQDGRVKIIIGSGTIKEGIDLQNRATTLYNCNLDWNPTDVQQVEGRVWRQGNQHSHVRVAIPLIENSIDIFMFQKLDEKTSRINDIWYRSGKGNVLDVDELDPEELKNALMTDPTEAARSMLNEKIENLEFELTEVESTLTSLRKADEMLQEFKENDEFLRKHYDTAVENLTEEYNNVKSKLKEELSKTDRQKYEARFRQLDSIWNKTNENNQQFHAVLKEYARKKGTLPIGFHIKDTVEKQKIINSKLDTLQKNVLDRFQKTFHDDLTPVIEEYKEKMENLNNEIRSLNSDEKLNEKVKEIKKEREEKQKYSKTLPQRIEEFKKHNHLASCLRDVHACKLCPKEVIPAKKQPEPAKETKEKAEQTEKSDKQQVNEDIRQLKYLKDLASEQADQEQVESDIKQLENLLEIIS